LAEEWNERLLQRLNLVCDHVLTPAQHFFFVTFGDQLLSPTTKAPEQCAQYRMRQGLIRRFKVPEELEKHHQPIFPQRSRYRVWICRIPSKVM
jgi:hypothetical protein